MTTHAGIHPEGGPAAGSGSGGWERGRAAVRNWLRVSAAFLAVQVALTDYGPDANAVGQAVFWFVVGAVLLRLVYRRRSRVARGVVIVLSLLGASLCTLSTLGGTLSVSEPRGVALILSYVGQAVPLLTPSVRRHVHRRR